MATKRAARYLRVSRADQNPALQSDETGRLIAGRGWLMVDTFLDHGVSGAKDRRPELDRLMMAAKRGEFDILVVWRSDRLFRSLKHLVVTVAELSAMGIDFVSVTEPFDTSTRTGRLLLHLVSAFAEFERNVLVERTKSGIEAARRRGAQIGRPRVHVDIERAVVLRAQGRSIRQVARALGCGAATLHRALVEHASREAA
jgi:DNA invertase Pin-like site-specific DNA recombinase